MEDKPGTQLKGKVQERYDYLDIETVISQLLDYEEKDIASVRFRLPQIHCASCIWLLENLHKFNDGIYASKVNFLKKEVSIQYHPSEVSLRQVVEMLSSIGYAPDIKLDTAPATDRITDKKLIYQLGVAGFCFGNIMMLSFPEYLGLSTNDASYYQFFGYLNIALSLPVLLYSGKPYWFSAWTGLKHGTVNMDTPITLGILALFIRSTYEIMSHTGAGYLDSLAGLIFFLLIGKWFQKKTYHALSFERDYASYFPIAATNLINGDEKAIPIHDIEPGDQLFIRFGELIPADGIIKKGKGLIDYSFVTGESTPLEKSIGDKVFAGGKQMGEPFEMEVTRKTTQSYLTGLWNDEAFKDKEYHRTQQFADTVGKYFTLIVLTLALGTLAFWWNKDIAIAMQAFSAVLIIACPCAIALSIPFTYGNILRILARRSFFIKHSSVIEALQRINRIIFDKTGTLTATDQSTVSFNGDTLTSAEMEMVRSLAFQSNHPASRRLDSFFKEQPLQPVSDIDERIGMGIKGKVKGMAILLGSDQYASLNGISIPQELTKGTVLAIGGVFRGVFHFENAYRGGLENVTSILGDSYQLSLLTGDNNRELSFLQNHFDEQTELRFQQSPEDKLSYVKEKQGKGERVMMIGDGLNDAGALKRSDVGIVLTESANNFTPASDVIMDADNFSILPEILLFLKNSKKLIYWAYGLALVYNTIGLSYAVQGTLSPLIAAILMPLSSITIVAFGVLSSSWLASRYKILKMPSDQHQVK
jgi:Cu+-exporting ATPase